MSFADADANCWCWLMMLRLLAVTPRVQPLKSVNQNMFQSWVPSYRYKVAFDITTCSDEMTPSLTLTCTKVCPKSFLTSPGDHHLVFDPCLICRPPQGGRTMTLGGPKDTLTSIWSPQIPLVPQLWLPWLLILRTGCDGAYHCPPDGQGMSPHHSDPMPQVSSAALNVFSEHICQCLFIV